MEVAYRLVVVANIMLQTDLIGITVVYRKLKPKLLLSKVVDNGAVIVALHLWDPASLDDFPCNYYTSVSKV
jgi:hypothetical protein